MTQDNGKVLDHYSKLYRRLFRYGPIVTGFIVASIFSFFLLSGQTTQQPLASDQQPTTIEDVIIPTENNTGTRDDTPTLPKDESRIDSIGYKNANYNLDELIKTIPAWHEIQRKHTDERTIISESRIDLENSSHNFTATIDHSSGVNFSFIQISTDNNTINETINTLIAEQELPIKEVLEKLTDEFDAEQTLTVSCIAIQESLSTYGEIGCDAGVVEVTIINKNYQRSYFFYHTQFALSHITTSDDNETQALSDITNIQTDDSTLAQVIDRILQKRVLPSDATTDNDTPSLAVSTVFEETLGTTPTSLSEKNGSFGINFSLQGINFFGIFDSETQTINGILFTDALINGKPLSVPTFSLNLGEQDATERFKTDPLSFLETITPGITDIYMSTRS